jgi:hypothetical protein
LRFRRAGVLPTGRVVVVLAREVRFRMGRSLSLVLVGVLAAVGLTACSPEEPSAMPTFTDPPTTAVSTTASPEDQAAAEAEKAYRQYQAVSRRIGTSGGQKIEGIDAVATGQVLDDLQYMQRKYIDEGVKARGPVTVVWIRAGETSPEKVKLRACLDFAKVYAVDSAGKRLKDENPNPITVYAAELVSIDGLWKVRKDTVIREGRSCA